MNELLVPADDRLCGERRTVFHSAAASGSGETFEAVLAGARAYTTRQEVQTCVTSGTKVPGKFLRPFVCVSCRIVSWKCLFCFRCDRPKHNQPPLRHETVLCEGRDRIGGWAPKHVPPPRRKGKTDTVV